MGLPHAGNRMDWNLIVLPVGLVPVSVARSAMRCGPMVPRCGLTGDASTPAPANLPEVQCATNPCASKDSCDALNIFLHPRRPFTHDPTHAIPTGLRSMRALARDAGDGWRSAVQRLDPRSLENAAYGLMAMAPLGAAFGPVAMGFAVGCGGGQRHGIAGRLWATGG